MNWIELRAKESNGFVSRRIVRRVLFLHEMLYGASVCIEYGKFKKVLFPEEVVIIT